MTLAGFVGAAAAAVWLYLLLARGGFWAEFLHARKDPVLPAGVRAPSVVAVVPARNEAAVVGKAVRSLAEQEYAGPFHIVLADDHSTDGTAGAACAASKAGLLSVVRARELPAGWTGKLWAVSEGIREAAALAPDYYLLTDADIVHPPGNLEALAARAEAGGYDLVSYMATLECRTPAERALVPAFVFFFFLLYPPAWVRSRKRSTAAAAGGCMLVRRTALEGIGGIEPIREAWIDDCALACALKRAGGRIWLGLSPGTRSVRGYETFGKIGRMISRSAFTQLRHSALLLAGTVAGMALVYLSPPVLVLTGPAAARALGGAAWALMSMACFPALLFYRRSLLWAPLLPLVATFYLGATLHSAFAYWLGTGAEWKGRRASRTSAP